jgi:hypothetical protein
VNVGPARYGPAASLLALRERLKRLLGCEECRLTVQIDPFPSEDAVHTEVLRIDRSP